MNLNVLLFDPIMEATGRHQGQKCFSAHRVLNHPTAHCPERLCDFPLSKMSDSSPLTIKKYGSLHFQWQRKTNFSIQDTVGVGSRIRFYTYFSVILNLGIAVLLFNNIFNLLSKHVYMFNGSRSVNH